MNYPGEGSGSDVNLQLRYDLAQVEVDALGKAVQDCADAVRSRATCVDQRLIIQLAMADWSRLLDALRGGTWWVPTRFIRQAPAWLAIDPKDDPALTPAAAWGNEVMQSVRSCVRWTLRCLDHAEAAVDTLADVEARIGELVHEIVEQCQGDGQ